MSVRREEVTDMIRHCRHMREASGITDILSCGFGSEGYTRRNITGTKQWKRKKQRKEFT